VCISGTKSNHIEHPDYVPSIKMGYSSKSDRRIGTYICSTHFIAIAEKRTELEKTKGKGGRKLILDVKETKQN
jgi:hypothetical protein